MKCESGCSAFAGWTTENVAWSGVSLVNDSSAEVSLSVGGPTSSILSEYGLVARINVMDDGCIGLVLEPGKDIV